MKIIKNNCLEAIKYIYLLLVIVMLLPTGDILSKSHDESNNIFPKRVVVSDDYLNHNNSTENNYPESPPSAAEFVEEKTTFISSVRKEVIAALENIFSPYVTTFIISMLPIFELRGSIPVGINYFQLNPIHVYFISIVGNIIPVFFILIFFDFVTRLFNKVPILRKLLEALFERTRKRTKLVEKYEELALIFFVAIPLPVTGAWTGSLASYLLGLRFWKSILCICIGVLIASIIVTTLSLLGRAGAIIALTVLTIFFLCKFIRIRKERMNARRLSNHLNN